MDFISITKVLYEILQRKTELRSEPTWYGCPLTSPIPEARLAIMPAYDLETGPRLSAPL